MEFANSVVNLIGNIICLGLLVTFLVGTDLRDQVHDSGKNAGSLKSIYAKERKG